MMVSPRLRKLWVWTKGEEKFYSSWLTGSVLHVCCGNSKVGDVRVDLHEKCDVTASYHNLPFADRSFDTVLCDPPWAKRERLDVGLGWLYELERIARVRIILIHKTIFRVKRFALVDAFAVNSGKGMLWKVVQVHDRR